MSLGAAWGVLAVPGSPAVLVGSAQFMNGYLMSEYLKLELV